MMLHICEVFVPMFIPKLDYIQTPEKSKSTDSGSHLTIDIFSAILRIRKQRNRLRNNYDTLKIDVRNVKILDAPGHTPGTSCYLIGHDYLVSGDNHFIINGKYEPFSEIFNMNTL